LAVAVGDNGCRRVAEVVVTGRDNWTGKEVMWNL